VSKFDVFLSHNSIDNPGVIKLKDDLARYGVKVWLDKDEIRPGDLFAKALEEGLDDSRTVALIISPEAMASGWVKEEYYRALSLCNNKGQALVLIPVILRNAEVPGFAQSRNWVDFRDEAQYAQNVWKLVWGVTGIKPPVVLDLTGPVILPPTPATETTASSPEPAPPPTTGFRTGGIRAGGKIQAETIVDGVQIQGGEADIAQAALELAKNLQTGGVEAKGDIMAKNIVEGFQYLGQGGAHSTIDQFRQELNALREELLRAIAAGEIEDEEEAEDARLAIERAAKQLTAETPSKDKITAHLDRATTILTKAGETAQAAGKLGAAVIKLAPLVAALKPWVEQIF
jgi:hypothetical protein